MLLRIEQGSRGSLKSLILSFILLMFFGLVSLKGLNYSEHALDIPSHITVSRDAKVHFK